MMALGGDELQYVLGRVYVTPLSCGLEIKTRVTAGGFHFVNTLLTGNEIHVTNLLRMAENEIQLCLTVTYTFHVTKNQIIFKNTLKV